jgi:parvulin-like peptidyl-prolyl isomerase
MAPVLQIGETRLDASVLLEKLNQYQLMPRLVQEIVIDAALEAIECDLQEACQAFFSQRQLFSEEQRQAWLQQQKMTPEQFKMTALREAKLARFKADTWNHQVESYFLQRKGQLDRVLYSLIRTKDASLAQELYFRLNDDGADFSELAREYSEGQEAQTGGLIGPVELNVPHPTLARILSISQPGQIWTPTPIGEWFVIARLEKFLPAQLDEAMRQRLIEELFKTWLQQTLQQTPVTPLVSPAVSQA